jgi:hypothetical protein
MTYSALLNLESVSEGSPVASERNRDKMIIVAS